MKDLTDAEALAWCQWLNGPGPGLHDKISDTPGLAAFYGAADAYPLGVSLCVPVLPLDLCVENLRIHPCTASVRELNDCVETTRAHSVNSSDGNWVGHGCGPLLSNPTCTGIVVQQTTANDDDCRAPLE